MWCREEGTGSVELLLRSQSMIGSNPSKYIQGWVSPSKHLSNLLGSLSPLRNRFKWQILTRNALDLRLARHITTQTRLTAHGTGHLDEADESGCSRMPHSVLDHSNVYSNDFRLETSFFTDHVKLRNSKTRFLDAKIDPDRRDTASSKGSSVSPESALQAPAGVCT